MPVHSQPVTPDDGPVKPSAITSDLTESETVTEERDQLKKELERIRKLLEISSKNKHMSINFNDKDVVRKLTKTGSLNEV